MDLGSGSGAPNWDFGSGLESVDAKMVVICLAVIAWHFATISLLVGSRKWSKFSRLPHSGNSRPLFDDGAHDNGRDPPG